ncbi:MAG: hypothetical protein V8Q75_03215 [Bacilli bacterium]
MASNNFINECKNRVNANRLGKIIVDGVDTPITNSDNLQSFSIDSGCYADGNIIGSVYAKCLKANFITSIGNLTGKSIQAQIGVKYADLSSEYISMGKYKIERPNNEITANMSQITAYDDLYTNLDNKYLCNIDYSSGDKTLVDLYIDVCEQLGLTPKTTTFINSTIPIQNNPFTNGEKNRTVLQTIAKISCSFIDIDNDTNKIDLCWLSQNEEPDYTFYKNDYVSVDGGQVVCGPINCLIIKNSAVDDENVTVKDEDSIETNGEHSIIISEDYILHDAELRQQAITNIWNRVKGMKYVDCKLTTYYGKPFLKLGDRIRIYTSENEYFDTYVLKHNFTYDGTFASIIESPALTEQEIKTKQDIGLKDALKNTQIDVDKQNQIITQVISQTNDLNNKVVKIETTINGTVNTISSSGGSNILKNPIGNFNNDYWEGTGAESYTDTHIQNKTGQRCCWLLNNGSHKQIIQTKNGNFTLSFMFEKIIELANIQLKINNVSYEIKEETSITFNVTDNNITIEFISDVNKSAYVMNLMLNEGTIAQVYSNNPNETITDTVKIGKGIQISATGANTELDAQADGIRIKNTMANETKTEFTDKGTKTDELEANKATIAKILIADTGDQTWINRL